MMTRLLARTALVLACAGAAPVVLRAQAAAAAATQPAGKTPDLSGTWELNVAKSNFGNGAAPTKAMLVMTQAGDKITRVQTVSTPMGDAKNTMRSTVGAATTDTVTMAGQAMAFTSTARWQSSTLVIDGKVTVQGMDVPVVVRYTLSPDGKQLMVDQTISTPVGEQTNHSVFDKKG